MATFYSDYLNTWTTASSASSSYSTESTSREFYRSQIKIDDMLEKISLISKKYQVKTYPYFGKYEPENVAEVIITEEGVFQYFYEVKEFSFDPEELVL